MYDIKEFPRRLLGPQIANGDDKYNQHFLLDVVLVLWASFCDVESGSYTCIRSSSPVMMLISVEPEGELARAINMVYVSDETCVFRIFLCVFLSQVFLAAEK